MGLIEGSQRLERWQRAMSPLRQGLHGVLPILRHQGRQFCLNFRRFQCGQIRKNGQIPLCRLGEHRASLSMGGRLSVRGDAVAELVHQVIGQAVRPLLGQCVKGLCIPLQGGHAVLLLQCPEELGQSRQRW